MSQIRPFIINKNMGSNHLFYLFFFRFYLFIFRERGREGEREGKKYQCAVASHVPPPQGGPGRQPRHGPWLGIEPATLWFTARTQSTGLHQPGAIIYLDPELNIQGTSLSIAARAIIRPTKQYARRTRELQAMQASSSNLISTQVLY